MLIYNRCSGTEPSTSAEGARKAQLPVSKTASDAFPPSHQGQQSNLKRQLEEDSDDPDYWRAIAEDLERKVKQKEKEHDEKVKRAKQTEKELEEVERKLEEIEKEIREKEKKREEAWDKELAAFE